MPISTKRKAPGELAAPIVKPSAKAPSKHTVDESHTSVSGTDALLGTQVESIEISSDEVSDEEIADSEDGMEVDEASTAPQQPAAVLPNGKQRSSDDAAEREEGDEEEEAENEDAAPSFGELLRGNEVIDVPSLLQQSAVDSVTRTPARSAVVPPLPSHQSLTTVLTQALKTDDTELLESCLQVHDLTTVQNTIERIDTSLAGLLLNHLATRLHRRPGRAGNLMTWVQWTIVSHGGALASQPKVIHNLTSLQKVLAERARGLQSLLALKGKLDLLEGQMNLRRKMQQNLGLLHGRDGAAAATAAAEDDDDDDEHVIWVEGQTDSVAQKKVNGIRSRRRQDNDDDDDDDGLPLANGIADSEDEEEDSDVDGGNDDDDVGAAEELLDEDEVDHEDVDDSTGEEEEESDVDAAAPPSKMQKVGKSFTKRK